MDVKRGTLIIAFYSYGAGGYIRRMLFWNALLFTRAVVTKL